MLLSASISLWVHRIQVSCNPIQQHNQYNGTINILYIDCTHWSALKVIINYSPSSDTRNTLPSHLSDFNNTNTGRKEVLLLCLVRQFPALWFNPFPAWAEWSICNSGHDIMLQCDSMLNAVGSWAHCCWKVRFGGIFCRTAEAQKRIAPG